MREFRSSCQALLNAALTALVCLCRSTWAPVQSFLCFFCRGKPANGDYRKDPRDRSRSPIERLAAPTMSLVGGQIYAHMPSLAMDQPLALTKNTDASRTVTISPTVSPVERQQVTFNSSLPDHYTIVLLTLEMVNQGSFLKPNILLSCFMLFILPIQ